MHNKSVVIIFLVMALVNTSCLTMIRRSNDAGKLIKEYKHVAVFPSFTEIEKRRFSGRNERLSELETQISIEFDTAITKLFKDSAFYTTLAKVEENDLKFELNYISEEIDKYLYLMYKKDVFIPINSNVIDFSVGHKVNLFADKFESDILVFSKIYGYNNTFSEQLKNIFKGMIFTLFSGNVAYLYSYNRGGIITTIVIDGNSGNIIFVNKKNVVGNFKEKKVQRKVKNSFKRLFVEY